MTRHAVWHMWRLSEAGDDNLGLVCSDDGLFIGRTPLIEKRDGHFVVREQRDIEQLLSHAYRSEVTADRLMSGLATVARALNANDQCLARIAAVHLRVPDIPSQTARDAMEATDVLIKYARDEGSGDGSNWNPALHPRTGTPPNPGWFAPTGGVASESLTIRTTENDDPTRRSDASPNGIDDWVRLPPGQYIDELHDFLEWLANAKPEDEPAIRAEIKRYYYDVGDTFGGDTLNHVFSDVLEAGSNKEWRQQLLDSIDAYAKTDPAEMGLMHGALPGLILAIPSITAEALENVPQLLEEAPAISSVNPWELGWAARGKYLDDIFREGSLHPLSRTIDDFTTSGIAISNKSIDLNVPTYQSFARLVSRVNDYVDKLEIYSGTDWGGDEIDPSEIFGRTLRLIVPKDSMTAVQREAIEAARTRASAKGIDLIITEF